MVAGAPLGFASKEASAAGGVAAIVDPFPSLLLLEEGVLVVWNDEEGEEDAVPTGSLDCITCFTPALDLVLLRLLLPIPHVKRSLYFSHPNRKNKTPKFFALPTREEGTA